MRSFALATLLASASLSSVFAAPARLDTLEPRNVDLEERSFELTEVEKRSLEERSSNGVITTCKNQGQFALTFDDGPVRTHHSLPEAEELADLPPIDSILTVQKSKKFSPTTTRKRLSSSMETTGTVSMIKRTISSIVTMLDT